jgi:RNA polymerase sigma-70 factor (ECF subfamily)
MKIGRAPPAYVLANLVDAHGDSVYRFCRSITYSKEDADDLFQDTFLKALEQLSKIGAADDARGFLFSAALYILKSRKRKYARRARIAPTEPLDEDAGIAGGVNPEDSFMKREEIRIVRELVAALPDRFKIPLILHYTAEMGVADIAGILKIPAGTVKSRLFKARKLVEKGLVAIHYEK